MSQKSPFPWVSPRARLILVKLERRRKTIKLMKMTFWLELVG
jgi:hypothetical protein